MWVLKHWLGNIGHQTQSWRLDNPQEGRLGRMERSAPKTGEFLEKFGSHNDTVSGIIKQRLRYPRSHSDTAEEGKLQNFGVGSRH